MRPKSVLIADDDKKLVRALTVRCQNIGLDVRQAFDAVQALVMINQNPPGLIIMDVHMPAGEGLSACQMLASDTRLCKIPVIVLTGDDSEQLRRLAQDLNVQYVVKSPECWKQLEPLICRLLHIEESQPLKPSATRRTNVAVVQAGTDPNDRPVVLIVDDDPTITRAVSIRLEANGYKPICAYDGSQAFECATDQRPDVITLDVGLPEMDGLGLLQNLKAHPRTKDIPVIVLTGKKDQELQKLFLGLGACTFLTKPFNTMDLMKEIQQVTPKKTRKRSWNTTSSGGKRI